MDHVVRSGDQGVVRDPRVLAGAEVLHQPSFGLLRLAPTRSSGS